MKLLPMHSWYSSKSEVKRVPVVPLRGTSNSNPKIYSEELNVIYDKYYLHEMSNIINNWDVTDFALFAGGFYTEVTWWVLETCIEHEVIIWSDIIVVNSRTCIEHV